MKFGNCIIYVYLYFAFVLAFLNQFGFYQVRLGGGDGGVDTSVFVSLVICSRVGFQVLTWLHYLQFVANGD